MADDNTNKPVPTKVIDRQFLMEQFKRYNKEIVRKDSAALEVQVGQLKNIVLQLAHACANAGVDITSIDLTPIDQSIS